MNRRMKTAIEGLSTRRPRRPQDDDGEMQHEPSENVVAEPEVERIGAVLEVIAISDDPPLEVESRDVPEEMKESALPAAKIALGAVASQCHRSHCCQFRCSRRKPRPLLTRTLLMSPKSWEK